MVTDQFRRTGLGYVRADQDGVELGQDHQSM
jgi:hypothetical protein